MDHPGHNESFTKEPQALQLALANRILGSGTPVYELILEAIDVDDTASNIKAFARTQTHMLVTSFEGRSTSPHWMPILSYTIPKKQSSERFCWLEERNGQALPTAFAIWITTALVRKDVQMGRLSNAM